LEQWIIHTDANYDAVPWPFDIAWDEFVMHPRPLVHACDDFGRVAPCDGLSETPIVPPNLPRLMPHGRYRMAVYHDSTWLYAFLEAENAPAIVPSADIAAIPHLADLAHTYPVLALLTPDQRFYYRFGTDNHGNKSAGIAPMSYGARKGEPPRREVEWDFVTMPMANGGLSCWRIARDSLADAFLGNTVRCSISYMHWPTLEAVAWGSHTTWGPRPDEFGTVRLVEERVAPPWPIARRVEMHYEPGTERARFRIHWDGVYQAEEADVQVYPDKSQIVPWLQFSVRMNGERRMFDLGRYVETDDFGIANGDNRLEIASAGGLPVRCSFEKQSGNRIGSNPQPAYTAQPARDNDWVLSRIHSECEAAIQASQSRRAAGEVLTFAGWQTYHAASWGRVHHYLERDSRLLEVLREHADLALTLQRADGSFAGLHLARTGRKPSPWAGGAYDTGPAGELWVVAAWLLQDEKYLAASQRLLHAYKDYRIEFNYNYAAFALYHLVAHYRLTRDPLALEHALYYCRYCVAIDLLPLGFHAGHNYYTCYGSITLRGMAQLCAVLPADAPYRATLREQCIRMANQVLSRQQPDGSFDGRNRFFLDQTFWSWGLFSVAFLLSPDDVARLDVAIQRLLSYAPAPTGMGAFNRLAESDFVRYWAHRDQLLAGEPIDLMSLV
jgi:hypothetical protein